jgi:hypothetical protein
MARPEKNQEAIRSKRVDIRLNQSEHLSLVSKAQAQGFSLSDYIRWAVLNSSPVQKQIDPYRTAIISGLGQIGKVGSNLNQIAHELHRERITDGRNQVSNDRITVALDDLRLISDYLLNHLSRGDERAHKG